MMPTSMTVAPGLTQAAVTRPGRPTAVTRMSARAAMALVRQHLGDKPVAVFGPHPEIVLENDRLAVEMKARVGGLTFQQVEQVVDQFDQPHAEFLKRFVPFTVPVGPRTIVCTHWFCLSFLAPRAR